VKKQSNAAKIRVLLAEGMDINDIAKKLKLNTNYVYQVKWHWAKTPKGVEKPKNKITTLKKMQEEFFPLKAASEAVNHPPHYTAGGIETIDFIEAKELDYHLANVVKYVSRAGRKGELLEDLQKAQWYLTRRIEQVTKAG
jgi:transposase